MRPITSHDSTGVMNEAENRTEQGWPGELGQVLVCRGPAPQASGLWALTTKSHFMFQWGTSRCLVFSSEGCTKENTFLPIIQLLWHTHCSDGWGQQRPYGKMDLKLEFITEQNLQLYSVEVCPENEMHTSIKMLLFEENNTTDDWRT